ncbi:MAG: hypothetical protein EPGJADBJ_04680 [Saprospiraceae bacterium]|nr:hypothetical protein [Saprospiraceae bacterium]
MLQQLTLSTLFFVIFSQASISAQYIAPRQTDDNITGVFVESPLTWQFQQLSLDSIFLRGYGVDWDTLQNAWGDTVRLLEQSVEPYQGGLKFTERVWSKQPSGIWEPVHRTEVFNPAPWDTNQKSKPDSVFHFTWNTGQSDWVLQKKIVYAKDSMGWVTQRASFLVDHTVADTLEIFSNDNWGHLSQYRLAYDFQNAAYVPVDSTVYLFVNDTFSPSAIVYNFQTGQSKPFRRYDFEFFNILDNYEIKTDYWSEEIDFWKLLLIETQAVVPNQYWITRNYRTITTMGPKTYKRIQRYHDSDWDPLKFDNEYLPSLEAFPDSVLRKNYLKDSSTGLISTIIEQFQPKYEFTTFFNRFKWEFAFGAAPTLSAESPVLPVPKILVRRLSGGVFQIEVGQDNQVIQSQMRLFDTSGRQLKNWNVTNSFTKIDISHFPAGVYYLNVLTGRSSQTVPLSIY